VSIGKTALSLIATLTAVWLGYDWYTTRPVPFERIAWLEAEKSPESDVRHRMADWLVESSHLRGKTRAEVVDLLGPVTDTDKFREFDMVYVLGRERGWMSIDHEWLLLVLDREGRVSAARVTSD
jgi:hypothetical protein